MRITTPAEVAKQAGNKYLGVLVAARFARYLNELNLDRKLARHRGALLDGQEPRRLLPLVIPGCRSARGRRARHAPCSPASAKGWLSPHGARRVPPLPLPERKGSLR